MKITKAEEYNDAITLIAQAETPEEATLLTRMALQGRKTGVEVSVFFDRDQAPVVMIDVVKAQAARRKNTSMLILGGKIR